MLLLMKCYIIIKFFKELLFCLKLIIYLQCKVYKLYPRCIVSPTYNIYKFKSFITEVLRFALAVYVGVNGFFLKTYN